MVTMIGTMTTIPAAPATKPVAFFDTECFPNYWLLKFNTYTFSLRDGESFDDAAKARIRSLFELFTVISFNGIYYDVPMIAAALAGYDCEQLKWLSDQIILLNTKPWELNLPEWKPADHIDLIEVAPGAGSQKQYAGRIHCKTMQDLPYADDRYLSREEMLIVDAYCENDLSVLRDLFRGLAPQLQQREELSKRYGLDLRSKSDAQLAEAVLKKRCEQALGYRIYKPEIDWNLKFRYEPPAFLSFQSPQLLQAFELIKAAIFTLGASGAVVMPQELEGLEIALGKSIYRLGIGGLHSSEKVTAYKSDSENVLRDNDVRGYYPRLILNSRRYPLALGPQFLIEFGSIVDERDTNKALEGKLKKQGIDTHNPANAEAYLAYCLNEGGKIMSNGTFGKTGSNYSILFAPEMLIQTTITGQLSVLMLIEWHEHYGIPVVSANTDGFVVYCPRHLIPTSEALIKEWEKRTGLEMEMSEYAALYSRDVNNYYAVKTSGEVKRKGEYSKAGLVEKKNPDVEICSDAVADLLSKGTPLLYTLSACRDLRKFVTVRRVTGGAVKLWGEGPKKEMLVKDMTAILEAAGWTKSGRKWERSGVVAAARDAYNSCFAPQLPEYIGKVIRFYYSTLAPGSIVYNTNGNSVSLSYGARPCMVLPDEFPADIDYNWYIQNCESILRDIAYA